MTRYTNLGCKRSYIEAGFSEDKAENEDATEILPTVDNEEITTGDTQPTKKKRKRTKHKPDNCEKAPVNAVSGGGANEGETRDEDQEVKNAYKNRDKNRKAEAVRVSLSEKRRQNRIQEKLASITCFACREKGHAAKDCPDIKPGDNEGATSVKRISNARMGICYRCGSSKHTLSRCRKQENPNNPLPYASCFVCLGKGHLVSSCPKNKDKGVYPNGGCCKLCGETSHLARNCPLRRQDNVPNTVVLGTSNDTGADEDDFHTFKRMNAEVDFEERHETRAKKKADVKMGAMSKTVKSFASAPLAGAKKVIFF